MTIKHKPRITWKQGKWMCWTPAIFGSRIVGWGKTPELAYQDHAGKVGAK